MVDAINDIIFAPTKVHLVASQYMLFVTLFVHLTYIGFVMGATFFSVFFNIVDRDTPHPDVRTLSRYLIDLAAGNGGLLVYLGVLPLITLVMLYAQVLYDTPQLTTLGIATAVFIVPIAFTLLRLYRSSFKWRDDNYPLHIILGAAGLGALMLGYFIVFSGISLSLDPEKWLFVNNPAEYFLYSWNNIARFLFFIIASFAITGASVLFFYFRWPGGERIREESYNRLVRNFAGGLTLAACLILPIMIFWHLITVPDVGKSLTMYHTVLISVVILVIVGRSAYNSLVNPERQPGSAAFFGMIIFFLAFSLADHITRENANRDHTYVLLLGAETAKIELMTEREARRTTDIEPDLELGAEVYLTQCSSCHAFGSSGVGPDMLAVLPKYRDDPERLEEYIRNPVKVDPNYPVMPQLGLRAHEIASVARYELQRLEQETAGQ